VFKVFALMPHGMVAFARGPNIPSLVTFGLPHWLYITPDGIKTEMRVPYLIFSFFPNLHTDVDWN
jgi:hypothetical protein